jgi:hypothetical protein
MPSTAERQLRTLAKLVLDNPTLRREIPDFRELLLRVLATAEANPFVVPFTNAKSKNTTRVTLGRFDLEQLVIGMLGDRDGLERLPRTLLDFDRRRFSSLLVQEAASEIIEERTSSIGSAMSYSTDCASGVSQERIARSNGKLKREYSAISISQSPTSVRLGAFLRSPIKIVRPCTPMYPHCL